MRPWSESPWMLDRITDASRSYEESLQAPLGHTSCSSERRCPSLDSARMSSCTNDNIASQPSTQHSDISLNPTSAALLRDAIVAHRSPITV